MSISHGAVPAALISQDVTRQRARAAAIAGTDAPFTFTDTGQGVTILLIIFATVISAAGQLPPAFVWLADAARFVNVFAIPGFLVLAGLLMQQSRQTHGNLYYLQKTAPLFLAFVAWTFGASIVFPLIDGVPLTSIGAVADIAARHESIALLLLVLPVFYLIWIMLGRFRSGTLFVLAAIIEILRTDQGGPFIIELTRGAVYFAAGHCFAHHWRLLARFARENIPLSLSMIFAWAVMNTIMAGVTVPFANGDPISALPFASLGLGMAGAAIMVMTGEILAATGLAKAFGYVGRHWIAFYTLLPAGFLALGGVLAAAGLFTTAAESAIALLIAGLAALVSLIVMETGEPAQAATASKL